MPSCGRGGTTRASGSFLINIDRFKVINDSLGHGCGDELLRQIADRSARSCVRGGDTVARMSADEFAIVANDVRDHDAAVAIAEKLLRLLEEPASIGGRELVSTSSIGGAIFPEDGGDTAALQHATGRALRQAKALGRNRFSFFTAEMGRAPVERLKLDLPACLRRAIENNELHLHYQPQVDRDGNLAGVEAAAALGQSELRPASPPCSSSPSPRADRY